MRLRLFLRSLGLVSLLLCGCDREAATVTNAGNQYGLVQGEANAIAAASGAAWPIRGCAARARVTDTSLSLGGPG